METQNKWFVANIIIERHIAEYTYGPGYYTNCAFAAFYGDGEDAFMHIYQKLIEAYRSDEDEEGDYKFCKTEEEIHCRIMNSKFEIKCTGAKLPCLSFGEYRYREHIKFDLHCLLINGMRDFDAERELLTRLMKKLTSKRS